MLPFKRIITVIYFAALAADCYLIEAGQGFRYFTKGLLMPLLMLLLLLQSAQSAKVYPRNLILGALLLSFAGDILLLKSLDPRFFIAGLLCFLGVQLLYIFFFRRVIRNRKVNMGLLATTAAGMFIYILLFLWILWNPAKELRVPVIVYAVALSAMLVAAVTTTARKSLVKITTQFYIPGAIFFVLSDSLLAIEKFVVHEKFIEVLVMITYGVAQYLITTGATLYLIKRK
ncbi:lysoplasmalogenase [Foetidibacter luteolus]|uniref:lysoplasmalogenase n=1 Tax=Foetidibacter luteolus TaxID=2608880 RepID=UPI00129B832B|nr:lysoplasmalogenase [Foetidibacter luteolus]